MGIDNTAILLYGWTFDYDEFMNLFKKIMEFKNQDEETISKYFDDFYAYNIIEMVNEYFNEQIPKTFKIGDASPYYDSGYEDRIYYISFNIENMNHKELYELFKLHEEKGLSKYPLLEKLGIKELPALEALPHIW